MCPPAGFWDVFGCIGKMRDLDDLAAVFRDHPRQYVRRLAFGRIQQLREERGLPRQSWPAGGAERDPLNAT